MTTTNIEQEVVQRARERLEEWKFDAHSRAYAELFEGENAALTEEELRLLDSIDSDLTRQSGSGLWDTAEYGIVASDVLKEGGPRVVCISHPEIPYEGYRGEESLYEPTREELNDLLWEYSELVATIIQQDLDTFVQAALHEE